MSKAKLKVVLIGILLVFAIIPALVVGAVGTFAVIGYENDAKTNTLETVALAKSSAVDQLFTGYLSQANLLTKLDAVIDAANGDTDEAKDILQAIPSGNKDIIDALVIDENGTITVSAKDGGTLGGAFEFFSPDAMPSVSTVKTWENYEHADALFVSKEIYANPDTKTGGKLGYVCLVISLAPESGLARALDGRFLDDARLALVDSEGNTLNFDATGTLMKSGQIDSAFTDAVSGMFSQTNNVAASNTAENTALGTAGRYTYICGIIPNVTSWRWVGLAETATFGSFAGTTNIIGWGVALVCCLIASALAVLIISKFIGSMHEMLGTLDEISKAEGVSDIRFKVKNSKSELGEIQSSFNDLLDEIYLSEERHRTIAELSDNMLFEWDFHKEQMYISKNTMLKFDINTAEATLSNGKFIDSLMAPEGAEQYKRDINTLLKNKNGYSAEYQLKTKSGTVIWVSLRATCITDRLGEPLRVIGVMTDIDNEKKMELQLSERASYDFLSQLYNRSTFIREFSQELDRRGQNRVGVMFLDVDDFKFINDRFGHSVGDEVIKFVADTIRKRVDDRGGFAGRFGGDEFVMCYTNQEDINALEDIAMDIIDELNMGYTTTEDMLINVKISIGITYCPEHSDNANDLLAFADTAMYFVKKNGKMNYHVYMPEDSASGEYDDPESYYTAGGTLSPEESGVPEEN